MLDMRRHRQFLREQVRGVVLRADVLEDLQLAESVKLPHLEETAIHVARTMAYAFSPGRKETMRAAVRRVGRAFLDRNCDHSQF